MAQVAPSFETAMPHDTSPACSPIDHWLPEGKRAAVVFSIDDVHPGRAAQGYDGGGDLGAGALGLVQRLLERHPQLHVTLFVTADWRETTPTPSRWRRILPLRGARYMAPVLPKGSRRIDRSPDFVRYLQGLPRTEVGCHGLHHIHRGLPLHVEFQNESRWQCASTLAQMERIFTDSGLTWVRGMCPPGWNAPPGLLQAMQARGYAFVASSRDINTPVTRSATCNMSGLVGTSLIAPCWLDPHSPSRDRQDAALAGGSATSARLLHFPANFQATSPLERALDIVEAGGLLSIKGHIIKNCHGHIALDGIDPAYCNYLDLLFAELEKRYGSQLWWTSMGQIASTLQRAIPQRLSA